MHPTLAVDSEHSLSFNFFPTRTSVAVILPSRAIVEFIVFCGSGRENKRGKEQKETRKQRINRERELVYTTQHQCEIVKSAFATAALFSFYLPARCVYMLEWKRSVHGSETSKIERRKGVLLKTERKKFAKIKRVYQFLKSENSESECCAAW